MSSYKRDVICSLKDQVYDSHVSVFLIGVMMDMLSIELHSAILLSIDFIITMEIYNMQSLLVSV
jgi:hypothetical protein